MGVNPHAVMDAIAAAQHGMALSGMGKIGEHLFAAIIQNLCADGNLDNQIFAACAGAVFAHAAGAAFRLEML